MTSAQALGLSGLHHVALRVADLERSLALYRDTLGFGVRTAFVLGGRRFALLDTGNSGYIELVETSDAVHAARADDALWHFALRVKDIERVVESVETAGYPVTVPVTALDLADTVRQQTFAIRIAFFRGPDGEAIELFEDERRHT